MRALAARLALALVLSAPVASQAQQVLSGDPVDPGTGLAYPIQPGLPLILPGGDEEFGTGDDVYDGGLVGDVDLVVRAGSIAGPSVPPPALAAGGPSITSVTVGGGSTGLGSEVDFTVMLSDGTGSPPYGNVVTNSDMDLRPVTVYAFADLDGDGIVGPTDSDGSGDNALELQEVTAYAGRQMGGFGAGRFEDSLGLEMGAPASLGGLTLSLVAGAYTGTTPEDLFTDGPLVLTHWPFFPPLDPKDLLGGGAAPAPDPTLANELEWDIETNYLPALGHPTLGGLFEVAVDGSEATTDQVLAESAAAVSARVFVEPAAADFLARARPTLRVAPAVGGGGRALVLPVDRIELAADGAGSQLAVRVLPVDLFANVTDPSVPMSVELTLTGPASIVSPDSNGNDRTETLLLSDAEGVTVVLDDDGSGSASLKLAVGGTPVANVALAVGSAADYDGDGVVDDGNTSGVSGDRPCDAATAACDDNCPRVINPSQVDSNHDGLGDCCDGTCIDDPLSESCGECALPVAPTSTELAEAKVTMSLGGGERDDKLKFKLGFTLAPNVAIAPDTETVALVLTQAGSGGYAATLPAVLTDLLKSRPAYRYKDREGTLDGVTKAQLKQRGNGSWKMIVRARGLSLADLTSGSADLALVLGDDVLGTIVSCTEQGGRVRCSVP